MFIYYNANPKKRRVGDCVVRAIALILGQTWEDTYIGVCKQGLHSYDMPDSNSVWADYLNRHGFVRKSLINTCPNCYTVKDFCKEYPYGKYLLATGTHVIAVIDGNYYDTWDSGDENPIYYFREGS